MEARPDALCARPSVHLPPREYWLSDPAIEGLIPTPLDSRGLVDALALFQEVAKTIDPAYEWGSAFDDPHHLQWPGDWYANEVRDSVNKTANPQEFRNLAISQWVLPRVLHNWIHRVTEPPPVPSDEVMFYRTEAQRVTTSLFMTVRDGKRYIDSSSLTYRQIHAKLTPYYRQMSRQIKAMQEVPPEFRLVELPEYQAGNVRDMFKLESALGRYATIATADQAMRIVRQASARPKAA